MEEADWQKLAVEISVKPVPFKHPGPTSSAHGQQKNFGRVKQQRFSSYPSSSPFVLNVLEGAISGTDTLRSLPVGSSAAGKSESPQPHKVNLRYEVDYSFGCSGIEEIDGGYGLALQASKLSEDIMAYQALLGSKDQD
uniref:Uncharacterized protein n=1 Tax=Oryza nivara TaxID=4536 RepID=A0A0E0JAY4_ORYNI